MDNTERIAEEILKKNLGKTLIQWIKKVNEIKLDRHNGSDNSIKDGTSSGHQH